MVLYFLDSDESIIMNSPVALLSYYSYFKLGSKLFYNKNLYKINVENYTTKSVEDFFTVYTVEEFSILSKEDLFGYLQKTKFSDKDLTYVVNALIDIAYCNPKIANDCLLEFIKGLLRKLGFNYKMRKTLIDVIQQHSKGYYTSLEEKDWVSELYIVDKHDNLKSTVSSQPMYELKDVVSVLIENVQKQGISALDIGNIYEVSLIVEDNSFIRHNHNIFEELSKSVENGRSVYYNTSSHIIYLDDSPVYKSSDLKFIRRVLNTGYNYLEFISAVFESDIVDEIKYLDIQGSHLSDINTGYLVDLISSIQNVDKGFKLLFGMVLRNNNRRWLGNRELTDFLKKARYLWFDSSSLSEGIKEVKQITEVPKVSSSDFIEEIQRELKRRQYEVNYDNIKNNIFIKEENGEIFAILSLVNDKVFIEQVEMAVEYLAYHNSFSDDKYNRLFKSHVGSKDSKDNSKMLLYRTKI